MELIGTAYGRVETELEGNGSFQIARIDPRSIVVAWFVVLRNAIRFRAGWRAALRVASMWYKSPSIFVDGACIASGPLTDPNAVAQAVADRLLNEQKPILATG
ncbi:MAG: hypothetical protein QGH20_06615 [Candidatus Latescibacteria bacterium]|jgi:hypothetical protein|nr:hypothetical protein [Candidatus Latescibacterota bacterium]